jgi:transposase
MFIRKVVNKSGNTSIQVVEKRGRKNKVVKHIGTARTVREKVDLIEIAQGYIDKARIKSGVVSFFDSRFTKSELGSILGRLEFTQVLDTPVYHFLSKYYHELGFGKLRNECFKDLVIARIVKPTSKRQTRDILKYQFGKTYSLSKIYRNLKVIYRKNYQRRIEVYIQKWIKKQGGKLTVVFFDVTTLYYEAFDEDDLRKFGFSKDNKVNQPQLVIGLLVSRAGLPLHLDIFKGNTFEGHTMLPAIHKLLALLKNSKDKDVAATKNMVKDLVIVADAAMLNKENLSTIKTEGLKYIVGARLGNLGEDTFNQVIATEKKDRRTKRISLSKDQVLIVSYSKKRASKDRHNREKQIQKAQDVLAKGKSLRRYKFISTSGSKAKLNTALIKKGVQLEGLKGYVTNALNLSNGEIVKRYSELWQVEKAFRMSKSDLKARPIFHTLKESIEAHLAIVFAALTIARLIELRQGKSLQNIINVLLQVKEVFVRDPTTREVVSKFTNLTKRSESLLKNIKSFGSLK